MLASALVCLSVALGSADVSGKFRIYQESGDEASYVLPTENLIRSGDYAIDLALRESTPRRLLRTGLLNGNRRSSHQWP
jgi:hypothetical protein